MRPAFLHGRDHTALGAVSTVAEGCAAIALSRGGAPKLYPHHDPNEDAALFVVGGAGVLLAVADGHSGHEAAVAALTHLAAEHAGSWTEGSARAPRGWRGSLLEALAGANDAILALACRGEGRAARTTLAVALVRPAEDLLAWASIGDSHLFRASGATVADLAGPRAGGAFFLGHGAESPASLARKALIETLPLTGVRAVVLATDGLSEVGVGVPDPEAAVADALASCSPAPEALRPRDLARAVVETALEAQQRQAAGDNVAAAVAWLEP